MFEVAWLYLFMRYNVNENEMKWIEKIPYIYKFSRCFESNRDNNSAYTCTLNVKGFLDATNTTLIDF